MNHSSFRPSLARLSSATVLAVLLAASANAGEVYSKPPSATGGVNASSWVSPDGSDSDMYAWDDFTLPTTQTITEVRWRGGYALGAPYGRATDFRVSFFDSVAGGFQPLIVALPEHEDQEITIATFHTGDGAGETPAGVFGGIAMYDYHFVLPTPVTLTAGVKYWLRVVAAQPVYPDWGMCSSPVGDGSYFRYSTGLHMFHNISHNLSFSLHTAWENLGRGIAGSTGMAELVGTGTLAAGTNHVLTLSNARPSSAVTFVLGTSAFFRPMLRGVLAPPPLQLVGASTDVSGVASWTFTLPPSMPAGTQLFVQAWIRDPLAVRRWAASNVLSGTTR